MSEQGHVAVTAKWSASWWTPVWEFFIHVLIGTLLFVLIAAPAVGLSYLISWLEDSRVSHFILWGLTGCEYLLFGVDLALFTVFILRQAWKALVKLW